MRVAVVLVTGFAQPAKISNGLAALRAKLEPLDLAFLEVFGWKTPEQEIARQILWATPDRVIMVGHSYGVWRLTKAAALLTDVSDLFSADGVSRDRPRVLWVPRQVRYLWAWRQRNSIIQGSNFSLTEYTMRSLDTWCDCKHHQVDEQESFQSAVLKATTTE